MLSPADLGGGGLEWRKGNLVWGGGQVYIDLRRAGGPCEASPHVTSVAGRSLGRLLGYGVNSLCLRSRGRSTSRESLLSGHSAVGETPRPIRARAFPRHRKQMVRRRSHSDVRGSLRAAACDTAPKTATATLLAHLRYVACDGVGFAARRGICRWARALRGRGGDGLG